MNRQTLLSNEIGLFLEWAENGFEGRVSFQDSTHVRMNDVAECFLEKCGHTGSHPHASAVEFAVILRQVALRYRALTSQDLQALLPLKLSDEVLLRLGISALPLKNGLKRILCNEWKPVWLEDTQGGSGPDLPALVPLDGTARARFLVQSQEIDADPMFLEATGNAKYRSPGQMAAVRAAATLEPGATLFVQLPTGGGKTDVAIAVLRDEVLKQQRTVVMVVPTVALAIDLERRMWQVMDSVWGFGPDVREVALRWDSNTDDDQRELIKSRIMSGLQPILITSPETLSRPSTGVGSALEVAARGGRISWFIIDEAHIVKQWGQDFRPEFSDLAPLRNLLVDRALENEKVPLCTMLLSATYTAETLEFLAGSFATNFPMRLVAANELRTEPEIWSSFVDSEELRKEYFVEALHHLPRPLIVYATKPEIANEWLRILKENGFNRSEAFTGKTVGEDRMKVLEGFRHDGGTASQYDVVVATSAFGLGVDYDQVRTVVHVCVPETVDRWYQEIGRGGRDGYVSTALSLVTKEDEDEAKRIGLTVLGVENAWDRFNTIRTNLGMPTSGDPAWRYFDLNEARMGVERGSYNRRWNKQVLRGLNDLGIFKQKLTWWHDIPPDDRKMLDIKHVDQDVPSEILRVRIEDLPSFDDFSSRWERWRKRELSVENLTFNRFIRALKHEESFCDLLEYTYQDSNELQQMFPRAVDTIVLEAPCGNCPSCRMGGVSRQFSAPPTPRALWNAYLEVAPIVTRDAYSEIFRISNLIAVEVEDDEELAACLQLLNNSMATRLVGLKRDNDPDGQRRWVDENSGYIESTPIMPMVIVLEGTFNAEIENYFQMIQIISPSTYSFAIGKSGFASTSSHWDVLSFATLKHLLK